MLHKPSHFIDTENFSEKDVKESYNNSKRIQNIQVGHNIWKQGIKKIVRLALFSIFTVQSKKKIVHV